MGSGKTILKCKRITYRKKDGSVSVGSCTVVKEGNGKLFAATLTPSAAAHRNAVRSKRAKAARERFGKPAAEVAWRCQRWYKKQGDGIVGSNCTRKLAGGFGGKARIQKADRVTLSGRNAR